MRSPLAESLEHRLAEEYPRALQDYLAGGGEGALLRAYELGRTAVANKVSLLALAAVHHQTLTRLLQQAATLTERVGIERQAEKFFQESFAPFEMTLRGYEEATATLRRLNEEIRVLNADLERRVQERTAALAEANQELESFSYSVSHDLRAPLRHIQGYVELLAKNTEGQLSPKAQHYLNVIANAAADMGQLIDDLLAFSRMGRAEMRETTVSLETVARGVIQDLEMATGGRNIAWSLSPLPTVVGDPAMLRQVLANLLDNAVKYSRTRNPARIEVGCAGEEGERIILFVRDNGVGFDMKYAHKLFGVFQRLHGASEFEGTGIGLANVRRIIARHGGRIWAEAALDQGATFYFTLKPAPLESPDTREENA